MGSFFKPKTQESTSKQENNPWAEQIPYLKDILKDSQTAYNDAKQTGYINQNPDIGNIYKDYLSGMQNSQGQVNQNMQPLIDNGLQLQQQSTQGYKDLMAGKQNFSNQDIINGANSYINNDLLNGQIQAATRGDVERFGSQAIQNREGEYNAGGYGQSGQILADTENKTALDNRVADVSSNMRNAAYQQGLGMSQGVLGNNQANYMAGLGGINSAVGQNFDLAGKLPSLYSSQNSILKDIGDMNMLNQQGIIADKIGQRDYMMELLGKYSSLVTPIAGMGGTSNGTQKTPGGSMFDKVLGAGQSAAGIYSGFGFGGK